jgi:translation initiation factor IF-3
MRISRRGKKEEPKRIYFYNEGIKSPTLLVLDTDGSNLGIMPTANENAADTSASPSDGATAALDKAAD